MSPDSTSPSQEFPPSTGIINFFAKNPLFGVLASLASILGLVVAFIFYFNSKETPNLTYFVNPAKAILLQKGQTTHLKASFYNKTINSDVTVAQIALWNTGRKAIRKDNILESVDIYTEPSVPILEARIRKSTRKVVQLSEDESENKRGHLKLHWKILEHNDGGVIQIIYAGSPKVNIKMKGTIEGQKNIVEWGKGLTEGKIPIFSIMEYAIICPFAIYILLSMKRTFGKIDKISLIIGISLMLLSIFVFYLYLFHQDPPLTF